MAVPTAPIPTLTRKRRSLRRLAVGAKGVAKLFSAGIRTVRAWDAAGKLPRPARINSKVLWSVPELRAWLAAGCPDRETWDAMKKAAR
jgi:hypothetical protein